MYLFSVECANASDSFGLPFVAPMSGDPNLRYPIRKNIINVRASFLDEIVALIDYLTYAPPIFSNSLSATPPYFFQFPTSCFC